MDRNRPSAQYERANFIVSHCALLIYCFVILLGGEMESLLSSLLCTHFHLFVHVQALRSLVWPPQLLPQQNASKVLSSFSVLMCS